MKDGTLVGALNILIISPRRSKVNETLRENEDDYDAYIGQFDELDCEWWHLKDGKVDSIINSPKLLLPDLSGWGTQHVTARSAVNTNAQIEKYLGKFYTPALSATHPWLRFDMIIVDEVHTLLSDASYQSAPFYVRALIEETLRQDTPCKIITMTGSPRILKDDPLFKKAHLIDRMDTCINVISKRISFITKKEANRTQRKMLETGEKFIAFYNHIGDMLQFEKDAHDHLKERITLSFSDKKQLAEMPPKTDLRRQRMDKAQDYLAQHKRLPDDVIAFLSTAKNKEGINIENKDIHAMFIESHAELDVIQMAGRLRNPADTLYIVVDSTGYHSDESKFESSVLRLKNLLNDRNKEFLSICKKNLYRMNDPLRQPILNIPELKEYLTFIHQKYPYIRFNYLTNRFEFYPQRRDGKKYYTEQERIFQEAASSKMKLIQWAQTIYPGIKCSVSNAVLSIHNAQQIVDEYLLKNGWLLAEQCIRQTKRKIILNDLNLLLGCSASSLNPLLKKYGYCLKKLTASKNANAPYVIQRLTTEKAA